MSFSTAAHISCCVLPEDEEEEDEDEPDSGQYRSCSLITMETYNIPHAEGSVLPALPFNLWLSVQQVQVFGYLATVATGHGFGAGDFRESAVNSSDGAAAAQSNSREMIRLSTQHTEKIVSAEQMKK